MVQKRSKVEKIKSFLVFSGMVHTDGCMNGIPNERCIELQKLMEKELAWAGHHDFGSVIAVIPHILFSLRKLNSW